MFFHRWSYKKAILVSLRATPVLCANLMMFSLRLKKESFILKTLLCFGFCGFGFEAIPDPG